MALLAFRGDAAEVAEVATITPVAPIVAGEIFTVAINGRSVSFTATASTVANVTAGVVAAWNLLAAADFPEHAEITAVDTGPGTLITLTHDTAGVTFHEGVTVTSSTGGEFNLSADPTVAAAGPNVWIAANFRNLSTGANALPAAGDTVWIADSNVDILYNLTQPAALLTEINITAGYTGQIGLPKINTAGTAYDEYRAVALGIQATTWKIGEGSGSGSARLKLHLSSVLSNVVVFSAGSSIESDKHAVQIDGGGAGSTLKVFSGAVDVAVEGGGEAVVNGGITITGTGIARISTGTTASAAIVSGSGNLTTDVNLGIVSIHENGTLTKIAGTVTTLNIFGAIANIEGAGTITNMAIGGGRTLNAGNLGDNVAITNQVSVGIGATINDPAGRLTFAGNYKISGGGLQDISHVTKQDAVITVA